MPFALDSVNLGGRLVQLQSRELRLAPQEVAAWARQNWKVPLQPADARALWRLTEGWPAALVLLGQHLTSRGGSVSRKDILGVVTRGRDLSAYFERHILSDLEPEAAQIMMSAALLNRVTFPRDETFLPGARGQAETVLKGLVSRGFLVTASGLESYNVHPLVRAFAEREALQSKAGRELIRGAAEHLERSGEHHQAASLYLKAGYLDEAGQPIRSLVLSSLNASINFARDDWLDLIPRPSAGDEPDPWLLVAKARILQHQAEYKIAAGLYERAARLLSGSNDKEGLLAVLLGSAFCLFSQGSWEESLAVMTRCRSLASTQRERVEVLVAEGNVLVSLCRWDEAVENWEKALALAPTADRRSLGRRIHLHRSRLFYSLGHYHLAWNWLSRAMSEKEGARNPSDVLVLNGATILAYLTGDYTAAARYADQCAELVRARGYAWIKASTLLNQAAVEMGSWSYRPAFQKIREAQALAGEAGDAEGCFWAEDMLGDLCRRNKNAQRALEHHQVALEIVEKSRLAVFERVRASTALGMDLAVLGREEEARTSLEETVRLSRRWGLMGSLAPSLFYLGWLYALQGREHEASRSLTEAMRMAGEHGHIHFFSQEAKVAVPVLALSERLECGEFVRESIIPRLPERLQTYFRRLTDGRFYPTDISLGPAQRLPSPVSIGTSVGPGGRRGAGELEGIETLTDREREVLKLITLGMSNKLVGDKLVITEKTVKTHTNNIYRKLGVASRVQAILVFQSYQRKRKAEGSPWGLRAGGRSGV
jgi:ATP/maltotriose-dependent transcriptional regulator MalT